MANMHRRFLAFLNFLMVAPVLVQMGTYSCLVAWRLFEVELAFRMGPAKGWRKALASFDDVFSSSVEVLVSADVGFG